MRIGNEAAAEEWFEVRTRYGACEVALNPSSREFKELYRKLSAPYLNRRKRRGGSTDLPPEVEDRIARECAAKAVLRGWRNGAPEDEDGEPLEFTPENAIRVFEDPVIGDPFLNGVMDAATALWEAYAVELEETAKN